LVIYFKKSNNEQSSERISYTPFIFRVAVNASEPIPFSGFVRVQSGHEQCFFPHFCDVAGLAIVHKTFNPNLAIHKI
jgi:hypothetical protein